MSGDSNYPILPMSSLKTSFGKAPQLSQTAGKKTIFQTNPVTQDSQKTMEGDKALDSDDGVDHGDDGSFFEDSDENITYSGRKGKEKEISQLATPSKSPRKGSNTRDLNLRFAENAIHLYDQITEGVVATCNNRDEFMPAINKDPMLWLNGIENLIKSRNSLTGDITILVTRMDREQVKHAEVQSQLTEKLASLEAAQLSISRLRKLRYDYRSLAKKLEQENLALKAEVTKLQEKLGGPTDEAQYRDSDEDETGIPSNPKPVSVSKHSSLSLPGHNTKYPNIDNFNGDTDVDNYDSWRLHVEAKLRQSAIMFNSEQDKIDYVRAYCKGSAFNVIKDRASLNAVKPYSTIEEMLKDLDNLYVVHDKVARADVKLHSAEFAQGQSESFEKFFSRFTTTISVLNYTDEQKISALKRTMKRRLRVRMAGMQYTVYSDYVEKARQCDLDLQDIDSTTPKQGRGGKAQAPSKGTRGQNTATASAESAGVSKPTNSFRAPNVRARLAKEGRCYKCLQPGHRLNDENAPCKDTPAVTNAQAEIYLKSIGIETKDSIELPGN